MKRLLTVLGLLVCTHVHAKSVVLDCHGSGTYSQVGGKSPFSFQVMFDDELNRIIALPEGLWLGCLADDEEAKSTGCKIEITKREIRLESSIISIIKGTAVGEVHKFAKNWFQIDRYTGSMIFGEHRWSKIAKSGAPAYKDSYANAALQCEVITAPKF
jgi:hypothetical protein